MIVFSPLLMANLSWHKRRERFISVFCCSFNEWCKKVCKLFIFRLKLERFTFLILIKIGPNIKFPVEMVNFHCLEKNYSRKSLLHSTVDAY